MSDCLEITFDYDEIVKESDKAICFVTDAGDIWIPKSQILYHDKEERQVTIPQWLAEAKDLD